MRKFISYICAVAILCSVMMPAVTIESSAATYTEAYFEDYEYSEQDYIDGDVPFSIPTGDGAQYFSCDEENGTVSIYREKVTGVETYVEHRLVAPKNFDLEFRLKQIKVPESLNQSSFSIRIATDTRYTWLSIDDRQIEFKCYGENASDPNYTGPTHCIAYRLGYDWVNIKAEVRDTWITWYIQRDSDKNYKELVRYRMFYASMGLSSTAVGLNYSQANHSGGFTMDWHSYTPYTDSVVSITSPSSNAEFTEGADIKFTSTTSATGTVKYYVNDVCVGSATGNSKWSNYKYTLTGAKPGIYRLVAEFNGSKSSEVIFTVKKSYSTSVEEKITDDLGIAFIGKDDDLWYTYKIVVGDFGGNKSFKENHDEFVKVYRKERGAADSEYEELVGMLPPYGADQMYTPEDIEGVDYLYGSSFTTMWNVIHLGYYTAKINIGNDDKLNTQYSVDNLQFSNGDLAYSGYVSDTDAEIFVDSAEEIEAIVLASYDENDILVDVDFAELNGGTNFADLNIKEGSVTKLYMWNKITAGKPLIDEPLIGE